MNFHNLISHIFIKCEMSEKDEDKQLNEAIERLTNENQHQRRKIQDAEVVIRRRCPNADGLNFDDALNKVFDERDDARRQRDAYLEELKKIYRFLLEDQTEKAKNHLNIYLFKNRS